MKAIEMYKCEGCGEIYATPEKAEECESLGIPEVRIVGQKVDYRFVIPTGVPDQDIGIMVSEMCVGEPYWKIADQGRILSVEIEGEDDKEAVGKRVHDFFRTYLIAQGCGV